MTTLDWKPKPPPPPPPPNPPPPSGVRVIWAMQWRRGLEYAYRKDTSEALRSLRELDEAVLWSSVNPATWARGSRPLVVRDEQLTD